ncbi:52 kDa repressor of the inhibitor of the protein kinase-like, partial [Aphis craccivora]
RPRYFWISATRRIQDNSNLSLFGFPKDLERSRQWITNSDDLISISNYHCCTVYSIEWTTTMDVLRNSDLVHLEIEDLRKKKIYSDHFLSDDYSNFSKKILKRTAVPVPYEPVVPFHVRSPKKTIHL